MINKGPAAQPPDTEQLIARLKEPIKTAIDSEVNNDQDIDRIQQISNARRNSFIWRGFQWLGPAMVNGVADWQPIGGYGTGNNGTDSQCYSYTDNIFRGNGRKLVAVLGMRAPNVTALPDDPNSDKGEKAARHANKLNSVLDSWWGVDERNMEIAETLWVTGPAWIHTHWNADGDLYGYREEPVYDQSAMQAGEPTWQCIQCGYEGDPVDGDKCPQCGAQMDQVPPESLDIPQVKETKKYANGRVECHVTSVLYVTTPFFIRDTKTCPWLKYSKQEMKGVLLKKWPQLRKMMGKEGDWTGSGTAVIERQAQDAVMSPTGLSTLKSTSRWEFTRLWLQTKMYEVFPDEETRKLLYEQFPEGLKISMVNGEIVDLEDERLDHVWAVAKPEAGDGVNIDPIGQDMVSAQMAKNQSLNIAMETFERGIPQTLADPRVWNFDQVKKRSSKPAEYIPALPAVGDRLEDSFYRTPPAVFSDQQVPFIAGLEDSSAKNVGITPAIFGGGSASTAREAEINKNAAMMQLGLTWTYVRKAWEAAKFNGARQLAKHGPSVVQEGKLVVEMAELMEANWHFIADEAVPTSWGQQRDLLMWFMEKPPAVLEAWGYNHPDNIQKTNSLLGMQGWYTPFMDDMEKLKDLINELLEAQPTQQPQQDGSVKDVPSIQPNAFEDNMPMSVTFIQAWMQKEIGRTAKRENPEGYANVLAYGLACQALATPPPQPPPPIVPKVSVSVSSKDLAPNQTAAILGDANVQVPPPEMPPQMPMGPGEPQGPMPQGPPPTIQ